KFAKEILRCAKIGAELTKRLLSFGRRQVVIRKPVDLRTIVESSESLVRRLIRSDLTLELCIPSVEVGVCVDQGQVEQVILNLVANARDAMPGPGLIRLTLDTIEKKTDWRLGTKQLSAGQYARLQVSDEGSGVASDLRETLFDPFVTSKAIGKGTGLGLSIVYSIATAHDGAVDCENNLEKGTTFTIVFPLLTEPLEKLEDVPEQREPVAIESLKILIADDQEGIRTFIDLGLQRLGMIVTLTADGSAAKKAFDQRESDFDVILLDAIMPKQGGVVCYQHIRKSFPDLPILFMSGYDNRALSKILAADENAAYISKPFTIEALLAELRTLVKPQGE
ncbi:MAG: ATP-binding protein, partial [Planctomycetota bacterium]|nr:ATP-binding protein [Planctomycetota bacterium]